MASSYNNWVFERVGNEVVRKPIFYDNLTNRPELAYQSVNSVYETLKAEDLIASGLLTSGLDWYILPISIYRTTENSGLTQSIKELMPDCKIGIYTPDHNLPVYNAPYQAANDLQTVLYNSFADNKIQLKFDYNAGPIGNWRTWYLKATYTIDSGTLNSNPGNLSEIYPHPFLESANYMFPSGLDIEWKWESVRSINSGITVSGTLDCYGTKHLFQNTGDYFPSSEQIHPYMMKSTHGDLLCYWGTNIIDTYDPTVSGTAIKKYLDIHEDMLNGVFTGHENPLDFFFLDGPTRFFLMDNRNNPLYMVPDQTEADDPTHFGYVFDDWKLFLGYVDTDGDFDPYDLDSTTYYGKLARRSNFNEPEESKEAINLKRRKDEWNKRFPLAMFYNGVDVDDVYNTSTYINAIGSSRFIDRKDFIYDESSFRHVGGWTYWWNWEHDLNDLWYYIERYRKKNAPGRTILDYMSTDRNENAPDFCHKHYMSQLGLAISLCTDQIYSAGRHTWKIGTSYIGDSSGGEKQLAERGFFRRFEIGDPISEPYIENNVIKRDFTNGYVSMNNIGYNLFDQERLWDNVRIKTYQLRNLDIPNLYGAWISDENLYLSNLMLSGMSPVKALHPELGTNAPVFSGNTAPAWAEFASLGDWYPSINFNTTSGLLTAGTVSTGWPELTAYMYADIQSGYAVSHGSFRIGETFDVYTTDSPSGANVGTIPTGESLITVQYKSDDYRIYLNGNIIESGVTIIGDLVSTSSELKIGESGIGSLGTIIIASGFHSDSERIAIENELLRRY